MGKGIIYGLMCPLSCEIKYVGQTTVTLNRRLTQHKCDKRHNPYKINWINKLDELELLSELKIELIEECSIELLNEREIFWISFYKEKGNKLVNLTDGGDGVKGHPCSVETRLKISKANKGRKSSDKTKEKISKSRKGIILSNEHKNSISKGLLISYQEGRNKSIMPDSKRKKSESLKKYFYDNPKPKKEKIKREKRPHIYTDEEILKCRERTLGENNPFYGKKHTDDAKNKISENAKLRIGDKNPFYGKTHSDKTKEKISNALKEKPKKIYYIYDDDKLIIQDTSLNLLEFFNLRKTESISRFCDKDKKYRGYYIKSSKMDE